MPHFATPSRRRATRRGGVPCVPGRAKRQRGAVLRGVIVATGLVAAVALQLGGSRLQCRLAGLIGGAPAATATTSPSTGTPSASTGAMRPRKVAVASAALHSHAPAV